MKFNYKPLVIAKSGNMELSLLPKLANRHGLITGATGTGKTVTLQVIAERLSSIGVPVFMADVKGDLSGLSQPGTPDKLGAMQPPKFESFPTAYWDVFQEQGHPVRATVSDLGPLLWSHILELNRVQSGVLALAFKYAEDKKLILTDLRDLRALLAHVSDSKKAVRIQYGNITDATIGAIRRGMVELEQQGAEKFIGTPTFSIDNLMMVADDGRGIINILCADRLLRAPRLYSAILLWLLSELYEQMPEVGNPDKPKLFIFDEAHLLFTDAPKPLLDKIDQMLRLIRSKGIGVYFVTQNPSDVPGVVLGQLGNRIQHALRAYTPRDQLAVRVAAETMRPNPRFKTADVITQLGVGEALVSFLDADGRPTVVERAFILPPASRMGPITDAERWAVMDTTQPMVVEGQAHGSAVSAYDQLQEMALGPLGVVLARTTFDLGLLLQRR